MKQFTKAIIVTLLLLAVASMELFAQGAVEQTNTATLSKKMELSAVDFEKDSVQTIKDAYQSELEAYQAKYESIYNKMVESYNAGNVDDYFDAKGMLRNLEYPEISQEQTEILVKRIENEKDEAAKADLANWLYENSNYYMPTLTFTKDDGADDGHTHFSFHYEIASEPGSTVIVPEMRRSFGNDGIFAGWGTGDGKVLYEAGQEIKMPYSDQVLYAVYKTGVMFNDSITGFESFEDGETIKVPELTAPDDSYVFLGWYDARGNKAEDTVTVEKGQSKVFTAVWKSVLIEEVRTRHYKGLAVPTDKAVDLAFSIFNQGSANTGKLTVNLVSENGEALKNISGELSTKGVRVGEEKSGSFRIVANGNSGDVINANIVVADEDGNSWSSPVSLTIK